MGSLSDDELEYLSPDFDPASVTMPKLRAIFVQHDVAFPSSAKKPQLIEIFEQKIRPQARKILSARKRIQRTSRGITDMPSSQENSTIDGDEEEEVRPAPKTPGRRSARQSVAPSRETTLEPPTTAKKTPGRRSRSKQPEEDEPAPDTVRPTARKSRKSEAAPVVVKTEEPEELPRPRKARESNFSSENPFQSGSSPAFATETKRRSTGKSSDRRKSTSRRETSGETTVAKKERPSTASYEVPVSKVRAKRASPEPEDMLEPGEEFSPEEQRELIQEGAARGEVDILRQQQKKKAKRSSGTPAFAPLIVLAVILAGMAVWYRKEKVEIGYCGIGKQVTAMEELEAPEWIKILQPECEPCPPHALCFADMTVECERDFILQHHPLSLGGVIPLPPSCEPDSEKERKVQAVANKVVDELRDRRAKFECGELSDETGKPVTTVEIEEPELKADISKKRRRGMSNAEFDALWAPAIGEVLAREEVSSDGDGTLRISSSSLAKLPLGCAVRRSARQTLVRYRLQAGSLLILVALLAYARFRYAQLQGDKARVPSLVSSTLDKLATQAALHAQGSAHEPFMSMGQMRDDVLRDEFSHKRRDQLWKHVKAVVEMNANVRANVRPTRNGEVSRVWEWIGNLPAVEDSDRRQSGLFAGTPKLGTPERFSSPAREPVQHRKWDEGHPIY